uniref:Uncharacterized protein n=1 Tax=Rhizophagus irregularis (strain DAOM 181602 / DAOM 197198 / MUCL 43194) TaxID=747089 RepID=U9TQ28_RHIID
MFVQLEHFELAIISVGWFPFKKFEIIKWKRTTANLDDVLHMQKESIVFETSATATLLLISSSSKTYTLST